MSDDILTEQQVTNMLKLFNLIGEGEWVPQDVAGFAALRSHERLRERLDAREAENRTLYKQLAEAERERDDEIMLRFKWEKREAALTEALHPFAQGKHTDKVGMMMAREALAVALARATICDECGSGQLDGEHIADYPCSKQATPPREEECWQCNGSGRISAECALQPSWTNQCSNCAGTGKIEP